jgi:hypothetical protein
MQANGSISPGVLARRDPPGERGQPIRSASSTMIPAGPRT